MSYRKYLRLIMFIVFLDAHYNVANIVLKYGSWYKKFFKILCRFEVCRRTLPISTMRQCFSTSMTYNNFLSH